MGAVQSDLKSNIVQASAGNVVIPPSHVDFWQTVSLALLPTRSLAVMVY